MHQAYDIYRTNTGFAHDESRASSGCVEGSVKCLEKCQTTQRRSTKKWSPTSPPTLSQKLQKTLLACLSQAFPPNKGLHIDRPFLLQDFTCACVFIIKRDINAYFLEKLDLIVGTGRSNDFQTLKFSELDDEAVMRICEIRCKAPRR